jgi:hypothetical protein
MTVISLKGSEKATTDNQHARKCCESVHGPVKTQGKRLQGRAIPYNNAVGFIYQVLVLDAVCDALDAGRLLVKGTSHNDSVAPDSQSSDAPGRS